MSVYKLKRKTGANTTEDIQLDYNTCIANKPTIPSAVTSINGLSGGKLTSPLQISGGDAATAPKIALDQTASGQITNNSTQTIFGFTSNNATNLTVGHSSYGLLLRGSGTRPKFNNNDLALYSDIPDTSTLLPKSGGTMTGDIDWSTTNAWLKPYLLAFKNADTSQSPTYPYTGFYQWGSEWQVNARDSSNTFAHNLLSINNVTKVATFPVRPQVSGTNVALTSDLSGYATVQVYNSEADAQAASQSDPNKICLF